MSKFELNQTVNESGKSIFLKLHISEKYTVAQRAKELAQQAKELAQRAKELAQRAKKLAQRSKELAQRAKELAQRLCDASEYEKDVKHHSFMNIWTPNSEIYQN